MNSTSSSSTSGMHQQRSSRTNHVRAMNHEKFLSLHHAAGGGGGGEHEYVIRKCNQMQQTTTPCHDDDKSVKSSFLCGTDASNSHSPSGVVALTNERIRHTGTATRRAAVTKTSNKNVGAMKLGQ